MKTDAYLSAYDVPLPRDSFSDTSGHLYLKLSGPISNELTLWAYDHIGKELTIEVKNGDLMIRPKPNPQFKPILGRWHRTRGRSYYKIEGMDIHRKYFLGRSHLSHNSDTLIRFELDGKYSLNDRYDLVEVMPEGFQP